MSNNTISLERISQLKAEISQLEQGAISELMEKRNSLSQQLAEVDGEIARLTGKRVEARKTRNSPFQPKSISLQELKELLEKAPEKTIGIRKEGLELKNIKTLANANPQLLKITAKGPWPLVTLLQ